MNNCLIVCNLNARFWNYQLWKREEGASGYPPVCFTSLWLLISSSCFVYDPLFDGDPNSSLGASGYPTGLLDSSSCFVYDPLFDGDPNSSLF